MSGYYIPYSGRKPKVFSVNGHRFVLLSENKEGLEDRLSEMGADTVKLLKTGGSLEEQTLAFHKLAKNVNASVVVAPEEFEVEQVLNNLESQLPWVH